MRVICLTLGGRSQFGLDHCLPTFLIIISLCRLVVCDRPERFDELKARWKGLPRLFFVLFFVLTSYFPDVSGVAVVKDGHAVSRTADYIIYSVEAEYIDAVVAQYGPCA